MSVVILICNASNPPPNVDFEWFSFSSHMSYSEAQALTYRFFVPIPPEMVVKTCYIILKADPGLKFKAHQVNKDIELDFSWFGDAWSMGIGFSSY